MGVVTCLDGGQGRVDYSAILAPQEEDLVLPNRDLFSWLVKYRVGTGKSPVEDFVTQAFSWLLDRNPRLRTSLFRELLGVSLSLDALVQTQRTINGSRIDLEVSDSRTLLLIENKLEAFVATYETAGDDPKNQIAKYQELAVREARGRHPIVVLLSQYASTAHGFEPIHSVSFVPCLWRDVHERLVQRRGECEQQWLPLVDEFGRFMEELGMTFHGIGDADAEVAVKIAKVYSAVTQLLEQSIGDAGLKIRKWHDSDAYRGCDLEKPKGTWVGIPYWGDSFGRVVIGFQATPEVTAGLAQFEPVPGWGATWRHLALEFADYCGQKPAEQVKKVSEFLKAAAARIAAVSQGS